MQKHRGGEDRGRIAARRPTMLSGAEIKRGATTTATTTRNVTAPPEREHLGWKEGENEKVEEGLEWEEILNTISDALHLLPSRLCSRPKELLE
eukprot:2479090-Pyramimonas_sp.AAC.1